MSGMTIILMIIFAFTFVPLVLAEIARNNSVPTIENFFIQGRNMNVLLSFFTVYATWTSSFAFLGSTASFYVNGPLYSTCFAWNILFALLFMTVGKRVWYYGKLKGYMTATDFFDDIYNNKHLSFIITLIALIFTIPYLTAQLFGGAYLIQTASGGLIPWRVAGLIFCLIMIIYLWAGGLRAVAMTDIYYGTLTFLSMIIAGVFLISKTGGVEETFRAVEMIDRSYNILSSHKNDAFMYLAMFVLVPIGAFMGPPMWIRMYAIKSIEAFHLISLLIVAATIMYIGPIFAGAAGRMLSPGMENNDMILIRVIMMEMPVILAVGILCGISAAALSTANSQIHALAEIYTIDIHKRYINSDESEKKLLSIGKKAVIAGAFIAYGLMLIISGSIIKMGALAFSGTAQIFIPVFGALVWNRSNSKAAVVGILAGLSSDIMIWLLADFQIIYAGALSLIINGMVFIILSIVLPEEKATRERIMAYKDKFYRQKYQKEI